MESSEDFTDHARGIQCEDGNESVPDFTGGAPWITISGKQFKVVRKPNLDK